MTAKVPIFLSHSKTGYYEGEDMISNKGIDFTKPIQLKTWVCKVCELDNLGVICSECKKMYNQVDPDCFLKE